VLRFTAWQKVHWSESNPGNKPRSWAARSKPSNQTQLGTDGVALEHMLALANMVSVHMLAALRLLDVSHQPDV
jgi:hypothetical protein